MNDFTKEELERILGWADVYTEFGQSWTYECNKNLIDKIVSMIDKFCEHEDSTYGSGEFNVCNLCEKVW